MHTVELYAHVRRYVAVDGHSQRDAARHFGISRDMVSKMMCHAMPPGYRRTSPPRRPMLDRFLPWITETLEADQRVHRKQRHTAYRIFQRLQEEHGYKGGYTVVKDVVREHHRRRREMFVPLIHRPGEAQVDFGVATVEVGGETVTGHFLAMDLPQSDAPFVMLFPRENSESFCQGHADAFTWFGGVPREIVYDNSPIAVSQVLKGDERVRTQMFDQLQSHYLFAARFARVGKGNDKGNVEGLVKYAQRTILTPIPSAASWDALNDLVLERCLRRRDDTVRGTTGTIGERLAADVAAFLPLPAAPFDCCRVVPGRVSSQSLVRFQTNDYSVPVAYGHREVLVKAYVHAVVVCQGSEVIAHHVRSYDRERMIFDPLHYLPLIERKVGSLAQAAPLAGWDLPGEFAVLHRLLERRRAKAGAREYVGVLRLHEGFSHAQVHAAVCVALRLGAISYDGVKHCLLAALEGRPPRLDLAQYPHLPLTQVAITDPGSYNDLLTPMTVTEVVQ